MSFDLTGKTALVTGTSGGIGQAIAIGLAEAGASVVAVSASNSNETVAATCAASAAPAEQLSADLSDAEGWKPYLNRRCVLRKNRHLVNNAGTIRRAPAAEHSAEDWHDVIDFNLNAIFFLGQLAGKR